MSLIEVVAISITALLGGVSLAPTSVSVNYLLTEYYFVLLTIAFAKRRDIDLGTETSSTRFLFSSSSM